MRKGTGMLWAMVLLWGGFMHGQDVPQATIGNGIIKAKLYLPDAVNGYYRASRFDWSGIMPQLEFKGHNYFGQWFKNYDPMVHESVMGPAEVFQPLDYEDTAVGKTFVVLGVGALEKTSDSAYSFFKTYPIKNHGKWKVKTKKDRVVFQHQLKEGAYGYQYSKEVRLPKGEARLVLEHHLTNTGTKTIQTQVYNHNLFVMDGMDIGPGYTISFPFELQGSSKQLHGYARLEGNQLIFDEKINDHYAMVRPLEGFDAQKVSDYDISIENKTTGQGVRIRCDRPMSFLAFWASKKTLCPEPYVTISVEPGETFSWTNTYDFYLL